MFDGAAGLDGIPADVDSIVVTIHNPPAPDVVLGVHVEPGQDSIVLTLDVPLGTASVDTVSMSFVALRTNPGGTVDTLYQGAQDIPVRVGQPSHADSVAVRYVGPGRNIASLALAPRAVVLAPGATFGAWTVTAVDSTGATIIGMPVLWHAADPAIAAVDATGLVRGLVNGETYVFAVAGARASVYDSAFVVVSTSPVAVIGLAPLSATFTAGVGGANPAAQTVAVTNTGVGPLGGLAVGTIAYGASEPTGWLVATLDQAAAPATLTLQPATGTLTAGTYHATVPVTSTQASNSPQTVAVTFTVTVNPAIGLTPSAVTFTDTMQTADPAAQTVAVANVGTGTLGGLAVGTITYLSGAGWLTATLNQATAPATLTLAVAKGALTPGSYTATVPVTSGVASNSPQTVTVTFDVQAVPLTRMVLTPGYGVLAPAGTLTLAVQGFNAAGGAAPTYGLYYTSRAPSVATVDSLTGLVTAVGGGSAVIVAAAPGTSGTVYDSTLVAVATPGVAVALPVSGGRAFGVANVGDTVHVFATVDLSQVAGEKLGSYTAELTWNPAVLQYADTATAGFTAPTVNEDSTAIGELRFGAANPNGVAGPSIGLVEVKLVALASGASPVTLTLTDLSTPSPTFTQLLTSGPALVRPGGVQVR